MVVYDQSSSFINTGSSIDKPTIPQKVLKTEVKKVTVNTDKPSYTMGETVKIYGKVSEVAQSGGTVVIFNPDGRVYTNFAFHPKSNGNFTAQFELKENRLAIPGGWKVEIVYLSDAVETTITVQELSKIGVGLNVLKPTLINQLGESIHKVEPGSMVGIESNVTNTSQNKMTFTFIVQIKDQKGVTVFLTWVQNLSLSPNESVEPAVFWSSDSKGDYRAEVFVWRSISNPVALAPVNTTSFDIG